MALLFPMNLAKFASFLITLFVILVAGDCIRVICRISPCPTTNPPLPIETVFQLPSSLPIWPSGTGFATASVSLGDLRVSEATEFDVVWRTRSGGPDNLGATFFEPSTVDIAQGYAVLGYHSQPNNKRFSGRSVVAYDDLNGNIKAPVDYISVWNSLSFEIDQDGIGYIWSPKCPDGYKALGHVVTNSTQKPSPDKIRCVKAELTEQCEHYKWIWGAKGFNVYTTRPKNRGTQAMGVHLGSFVAQVGGVMSDIACLKNTKSDLSAMPTLDQLKPLIEAYAPWVFFHSDEYYLPATPEWFFENGGMLYKKGDEANPVAIKPDGSNLPQGGSDDGAYWIDMPPDSAARDKLERGNLAIAKAFVHVKPMFGATFTDIVIWMYYPFNGPATIKFKIFNIKFDRLGEHTGDWEHVTLRVNNFNGELQSIYLSEHSGGMWVDATDIEFQDRNKPAVYASKHGHAFYSKPGLVLDGSHGIGLRNDCEKADLYLDTGLYYTLVSAEYLGTAIVEPPWINYSREWGPRSAIYVQDEIDKIIKRIPVFLRGLFRSLFFRHIPIKVLEEEGPTSIKTKSSWYGDEI
ncbi:hypothetical protein At1g04090-like [Castanea sativa]|uniref:hypothetical protein At1g04090-like n=1 Tax=Castanea sativa TaxID=21020 RepID=UPI003F64EE94